MKRHRPLSPAALEFCVLGLLACGQVESNGTGAGAGGVSVGSSAGVERPPAGQEPRASAGSPGISFAGSSNGGAGGLASGGAPSPAGSGTAGDGASAGSSVRGHFRSLGFMNGTDIVYSPAISADGAVVVATATASSAFWERLEAVKWTLEGGFESLGLTESELPNPITSSAASVNGDGSVIVGDQRTLSYRPFLYHERMARYLTPEESSESTATWDVSDDGSVVVGMLSTEDGDSHAFRWTAETGMVELESLSASSLSTPKMGTAYGVSGDGRVAVGLSGDHMPVMWDANGTIHILPTPDSFYHNDVRGVNYDGSKIVGSSSRLSFDGGPVPSAAALWSDGVWQELVPVPGAIANYAYSTDADGSVVVGTSDEAAIWIDGAPAQTIRRLFEDAGHDLTGWRLHEALGVSSDGRVVVGMGSYEGRDQAWIGWLP